MRKAAVTTRQIAELLGTEPSTRLCSVNAMTSIEAATPNSIVFASDPASLVRALGSKAGLILASTQELDERVMQTPAPRTAFARIYREWFDERGGQGIHPTAIVHSTATLGPGCEIGAATVIERGVVLGEGCVIGPRVTIHSGTVLGVRVRVQSGAVLGSDGFGYVREPDGYYSFPQIGTLLIGDDVEIGANTTIDRGALGETRVGSGTKIDNLVHIAHNCCIGRNVIIAAQVGMAGSTTIEDDVMLGGQVGLGERVTISAGVILGGQGGVLPGKTLSGKGEIFWGTPARPVREYLRDLARLRKR